MSTLPTDSGAWSTLRLDPAPLDLAALHRQHALHRWLARRAVRVALLLAAVWLLNAFDFWFTMHASSIGPFVELNPVAARVLDTGDYWFLAAYKAGLVGIGTSILWCLRRFRMAELGCWMLTLLYSGVALRWHHFYSVWHPID